MTAPLYLSNLEKGAMAAEGGAAILRLAGLMDDDAKREDILLLATEQIRAALDVAGAALTEHRRHVRRALARAKR